MPYRRHVAALPLLDARQKSRDLQRSSRSRKIGRSSDAGVDSSRLSRGAPRSDRCDARERREARINDRHREHHRQRGLLLHGDLYVVRILGHGTAGRVALGYREAGGANVIIGWIHFPTTPETAPRRRRRRRSRLPGHPSRHTSTWVVETCLSHRRSTRRDSWQSRTPPLRLATSEPKPAAPLSRFRRGG